MCQKEPIVYSLFFIIQRYGQKTTCSIASATSLAIIETTIFPSCQPGANCVSFSPSAGSTDTCNAWWEEERVGLSLVYSWNLKMNFENLRSASGRLRIQMFGPDYGNCAAGAGKICLRSKKRKIYRTVILLWRLKCYIFAKMSVHLDIISWFGVLRDLKKKKMRRRFL